MIILGQNKELYMVLEKKGLKKMEQSKIEGQFEGQNGKLEEKQWSLIIDDINEIRNDKRIMSLIFWVTKHESRLSGLGVFLFLLIDNHNKAVFSFDSLQKALNKYSQNNTSAKLHFGQNRVADLIRITRNVGLISTRTITGTIEGRFVRTYDNYSINKNPNRAKVVYFIIATIKRLRLMTKADIDMDIFKSQRKLSKITTIGTAKEELCVAAVPVVAATVEGSPTIATAVDEKELGDFISSPHSNNTGTSDACGRTQ